MSMPRVLLLLDMSRPMSLGSIHSQLCTIPRVGVGLHVAGERRAYIDHRSGLKAEDFLAGSFSTLEGE